MRVANLLVWLALVPLSRAATTDARLAERHSKDHPATFTADFPDRFAWETRAERLRTQVLVAQGIWPLPEKTPLEPQVYGAIDRDGYRIEKVYFRSRIGHYVTGNLYRPKNRPGRLPAVLCPYGHWPDGRFIWKNDAAVKKEFDSGAETDPIAARTPLQANCVQLVRMGCIVLQYDMIGYGDSTTIKHKEGFADVEAVLRGQSFMGLQTWNSIRAFDFVASLPDVDPQRIAVTGSSSGGTQAIALNAADGRAAAAFPMVMVSMNMQGGCVCENAPLYRVGTNNVELASLFAPKPQGMAAANDWTRDFMTRGLPEMKRVWSLYGAADAVWGEHFNFGHNHNLHSRLAQYEFLNRHLKLGCPTPIRETPFVPVEPRSLSVWDAEHPLPSDFLNAGELRKKMAAASDAQLAQLSTPAFADVFAKALRAMVVDDLPDADEVELGDGWIGRKGGHEHVAVRWAVPARGFDGTVILARALPTEPVGPGPAYLTIDSIRIAPTTQPADLVYSLGYERSDLANEVHDLLTAVAYLQKIEPVRRIRLDGDGPAVLIAAAIAGTAVDRCRVDLRGFDFNQITDAADPRVLPSILKFGGIDAIASLRTSGRTLIVHPMKPLPRTRVDSHVLLGESNDGDGFLLGFD